MNPEPTIDALRTAAQTLRAGDARARLHAIQTAQDALDGAKALALAELKESKDYELDGSSSVKMWVRTQLRLDSGRADTLLRGMTAIANLPLVGQAAVAGRISAGHVRVFSYGINQLGLEPMRACEETLLNEALGSAPGEFFDFVRELKDKVHPEDLDKKWEKGMDREDFSVDAVPDGFHVNGFLGTLTGGKLKKVLDSISAPRDKDDTRTGSERRVQGLDDLMSSILANGLPSDKGVKPHLSVFVDGETLQAAAEHVQHTTQEPYLRPDPMPPVEPATLAGHGRIGPHLLMYLTCLSDFTAFLMKDGDKDGTRQAQVLNAGRGKYQPNILQRRSVLARQKGICATPGCNHTHLEIHHTIWWSLGGPTDLDLLVGLCTRCHHLLHRGRLRIEGNAVTGFTFTNTAGHALRRRRRTTYRQAA